MDIVEEKNNKYKTKSLFKTNKAIKINKINILNKEGDVNEQYIPSINKKTAVNILNTCLYIRKLDIRMMKAQRQGKISFYLTCAGEEGAVTAAAAGLHSEDVILAQYREQAALRYRGFQTEDFINQLFGNKKDLNNGRQMPVHYGSKKLNYHTISSPLATQIPQATGVAYAQKIQQEPNCTLCFFGEGAASEGDFHAGLNMAAVLEAPCIFFCRNNNYAISTTTKEQYLESITAKALAYGINSVQVDGNDILAVLTATQQAREYVIAEKKPFFIEALTYRMGSHSSSDDTSCYRSKEEEQKWLKYDSITRFSNWLIANKYITAEEIAATELQYEQEIINQIKISEQIEPPSVNSIITDVYKHPTKILEEQLADILNNKI